MANAGQLLRTAAHPGHLCLVQVVIEYFEHTRGSTCTYSAGKPALTVAFLLRKVIDSILWGPGDVRGVGIHKGLEGKAKTERFGVGLRTPR